MENLSLYFKERIIVEWSKSMPLEDIARRFNLIEWEVMDVIKEYIEEPYIIVQSKINTYEPKEGSDGDA